MTPADPVAAPRRLACASYNIHSCVGRDRRYRPGRILEVLEEISAEVYALQEVDARLHRTEQIDQFHFLAEETGLDAIAGPNIRDKKGQYGNVLLSARPILRHRLVDLSEPRREPRGAIVAVLDLDGGAARVVTTHLGLRRRERRRQIQLLDAALAAEDAQLPTLFMGDFNIWGAERAMLARLGAPLGRADPRTWPAGLPLLPLDRVWCTGGARLDDLKVHRTALSAKASDHLPVTATMELPSGGA